MHLPSLKGHYLQTNAPRLAIDLGYYIVIPIKQGKGPAPKSRILYHSKLPIPDEQTCWQIKLSGSITRLTTSKNQNNQLSHRDKGRRPDYPKYKS
jgi:hypothetical protein